MPSRAELAAMAARPTPPVVRKAAMGAAVIGGVVFIAYLFIDPDRAWRAFHFNWLFFAFISSAAELSAFRITSVVIGSTAVVAIS